MSLKDCGDHVAHSQDHVFTMAAGSDPICGSALDEETIRENGPAAIFLSPDLSGYVPLVNPVVKPTALLKTPSSTS